MNKHVLIFLLILISAAVRGMPEWLNIEKDGTFRMETAVFQIVHFGTGHALSYPESGEWKRQGSSIIYRGRLAGGDFSAELISIQNDKLYYRAKFSSSAPVKTLGLMLVFRISDAERSLIVDGKKVVFSFSSDSQKRAGEVIPKRKCKQIVLPLDSGSLLTISGKTELKVMDSRDNRPDPIEVRLYFQPSAGMLTESEMDLRFSLRKIRSEPVAISTVANMGFRDEIAGDGKGGWTDQGRNDMRMFLINHVGRNNYEEDGQPTPVPPFPEENLFCGIPFYLTAPKKNDGKGVLSFGSVMAQKLMREVKGIPVEAEADLFHVLHASAWMTEKPGTPIAEYILHYADGSRATVPVRAQFDICDWWNFIPGANCQIAWAGRNKQGAVNLYLSTFRNPHPDKRIRTVDIRAGLTAAQYVVVGITFAKAQKATTGELVPVLKAAMDFSRKELLPAVPGCYYSPEIKFQYSEHGAEFTEKNGCVVVFPTKNNPMKNFQRNPFEIVLEVTPLKYPTH